MKIGGAKLVGVIKLIDIDARIQELERAYVTITNTALYSDSTFKNVFRIYVEARRIELARLKELRGDK